MGDMQMVRVGCYWIDDEAARRAAVPGDARQVASLVDRLLHRDAKPLQLYKNEPQRSHVLRFADGDRQWIVKRYRKPLWQSQIEMALRAGTAWGEWRGAWRLAFAGLRVCLPVAIAHQVDRGEEATALVLPYVGYETLHHVIIAERDRPAQLAKHVGAQIGRMLAAGYVNRDHKTGNLMIDDATMRGEVPPTIIDTVAIRPRIGNRAALQMIATLYRTALRAGPVRRREALAALKAARAEDAQLRAMPLRQQVRAILAMVQ